MTKAESPLRAYIQTIRGVLPTLLQVESHQSFAMQTEETLTELTETNDRKIYADHLSRANALLDEVITYCTAHQELAHLLPLLEVTTSAGLDQQ